MLPDPIRKIIVAVVVLAWLWHRGAFGMPPSRVPERDEQPSAPKAAPAVDLSGISVWGPVTHQGGRVIIDGHVWAASGAIQADGRLQVVWTMLDSGRTAIGVYAVQAGGLGVGLSGKWGWLDECRLTERGDIEGPTMGESFSITKGETEEPE